MPPARPTTGPAKRKGPSFKPPRPTKVTKPSTEQAKPARGRPPTKSTHGKPSTAKGKRPAPMVISSEEEAPGTEDDEEQDISSDDRNTRRSEFTTASAVAAAAPPPASQDAPTIPRKLLARLLHEGFVNKDVRVGVEAMQVVGKYVEIFVREAVARAALEREEAEGSAVGEGFLDVEDLEKLAPQLLLDF
ncbi:CENP-S associating centromere protein X-domain-containing protein [Cryomyces antarcticus]|uniref:Centromere protein X n=1 Tax=Cryomyces antarcticus TaxID=329879 RepID=A0ABR0KSG5_9PEZI|nr:hypothetical protein LTR39_004259 [Cryomyces antarcticus]KAK5014573.1 hypothetical protein LTR60_003294 [Cryomyces antarcticus]KAK5124586.1 hypothetical protein LTR16_003497 [Cryomyces antarcticus]KAK5145014.1 hypothetical protein LTR04_001416 [Oleoguttula sp. CCFEE 6159]